MQVQWTGNDETIQLSCRRSCPSCEGPVLAGLVLLYNPKIDPVLILRVLHAQRNVAGTVFRWMGGTE